ncbi:tribbles homolog 2-like [Argopecten irradians]|uniref:tribbles homolog 2-like n=1 Tax=Argopecten irradians TaxID=31199 RepID=UPI0037167B41
MSLTGSRPRLSIPSHGPRKKDYYDTNSNIGVQGALSPDLQPSQPLFPEKYEQSNVSKIGKYLLLDQIEGDIYKAVNWQTKDEYVCKIFPINRYREELETYWQVDCHPNISSISEITLGETKAYVFFERHYGDLHSYVRQKKRLKEEEASRLFEQISDAVYHCHENGIVLRDLKLRKFVFKNPERTQLRLDGLEDACVLEDEADDRLADKHGCPAYVSPEILHTSDTYSGRSADIWSLGVMLYTMLVGRYPFHDSEPSALFGKIRRGQFTVPQMLSSKAKCLIKSLLRREPTERLTAGEVLQHPWVQGTLPIGFMTIVDHKNLDQAVPNVILHEPEEDFFV